MAVRPATMLVQIALRRAACGTGSSPSFFAQRTALQALPPLQQVLGPIPWVLVGALALRAYIPERMTQVAEILVHTRDSGAVCTVFTAAGYQVVEDSDSTGFRLQSADQASLPIQVRTRQDSWLDAMLALPVYDVAGSPVLARPYLILWHLQVGQPQHLADVLRLLAYTSETQHVEYTQLIQQESPELLADLQMLLMLADLEFENNLSGL